MDAHANAAYSLVATAPSPASSGTSLVVTAGEGARFPAAPFNATVWATGAQPVFGAGTATGGNFEIVRVTAVSTDTLTIVRAQESSTARTIVVGDQIAATVTAKTLTDVETVASAAYAPSGTDVAVADGGTGASTASGARTNLGLGTLATQSGTFSGTSSGTNTGDQTTVSGNAGTATALATGRTIDGQTFDGTANITVIAPGTHAATSKTTPVDADEVPLVDSAASNVLKKLTWANLKATLKTYFDGLYQASGAAAGGDLTGTYPNPTLAAAGPGATGPVGDSTHVAAVTIDAKGRVTTLSSVAIAAGTSGGTGVYGDGSDGTVTFDGSTTVLGIAPSSNVYTLTRDLFLAAATINNGVSIKTNGFRIYCAGTLTNNGTIHSDGSLTNNSFGGANAGGNNGTINGGTASSTGGNNGGTAAGTAASNQTQAGLGGAGGAGGTGTSGAGGAGGTVTALAAIKGSLRSLPQAAVGLLLEAGVNPTIVGAGGGGGGGGGDTTNSGGGGGGGGGGVVVVAKTFAGTGAIHARGGNGSSPVVGNVGGGGGGGGGWVVVVSQSVVAGAISGQTIDANGGSAGSAHGTGTNNAVAGGNGTVILLAT